MTFSKINVLFSRKIEQLTDAFNVLPATRFNLIGLPTITIEQVETYTAIDQAFSNLSSFSYIIFTSQYAVLNTMSHLKRLGMSPLALQHMTICSVGPMVSQQLNRFNLNSQMMPGEYTAKALAELFPSVRKNSKKVLFPKGNLALGIIERALNSKGYNLVAPTVYRTEYRQDISEAIYVINQNEALDCIALTSPSSVLSFASALKRVNQPELLNNTSICAIGPTTASTCLDIGWEVKIVPSEFTVQSMARAIVKHFQKNPKIRL